MFALLRRMLFGAPLSSALMNKEKLPRHLALPVFGSDNISSIAYATEEMLLVLVVLGSMAWVFSIPVALGIVALLAVVVMSYRLTILSYPESSGAYSVTRENLGKIPSLIAASSILFDYVLVVAVSISAGVAAIVSAFPSLAEDKSLLAIAAVAVVALVNLRGLKESGYTFAVLIYPFIISMFITIAVGLYKVFTGSAIPKEISDNAYQAVNYSGLVLPFLIVRAFAGGCVAMTGIEAMANGTSAFKEPKSKNAASTLVWMAGIVSVLFIGITYLAKAYQIMPNDGETVISQIVSSVFEKNAFYYFVQFSTFIILLVAANTAFADFPRLASILAKDRYAPKQLKSLGDKLVFNNGILVLAGFAIAFILIFGVNTHKLIPFYAIGVFITFTLSQLSMFVRLKKTKPANWKLLSILSGAGTIITFAVVLIVSITKFMEGSYIALIAIAVLVYMFLRIKQHYIELGDQLRIKDIEVAKPIKSTAIVLIAGIHRGSQRALNYAKTL
ncbi:MAG: APC family permease, partial [Armatimonadota bacterium]